MKHIRSEFITVLECARHWGVCTKTVYNMIKSGVLPATKFCGKHQIAWPDIWACEQGHRPRKRQQGRYKIDLLSREQMVERSETSLRTVDRWLAQGLPTRNVGTCVRVNPQDAADWLNARGKKKIF